ncbi:MAG: hypothetical protein KBS60_01230 [Phascolarctobacterium sp.]|nr:hypothetical protein [Candidatus Phascolarctobacterium caballi]
MTLEKLTIKTIVTKPALLNLPPCYQGGISNIKEGTLITLIIPFTATKYLVYGAVEGACPFSITLNSKTFTNFKGSSYVATLGTTVSNKLVTWGCCGY